MRLCTDNGAMIAAVGDLLVAPAEPTDLSVSARPASCSSAPNSPDTPASRWIL